MLNIHEAWLIHVVIAAHTDSSIQGLDASSWMFEK